MLKWLVAHARAMDAADIANTMTIMQGRQRLGDPREEIKP
jgi:hypothetical protein